MRANISDYLEGGIGVDGAIEIATALEATGQIDFVNCSAGDYLGTLHMAPAPSDLADGWLIDDIAKLKAAVSSVPVFVVGGIKDAALADELIASGRADMVAMTRAQIADPEFANKVREGREDEIYHCIRCNQGCVGRIFRGTPSGCTVNPVAGREARFGVLPAAESPGDWLVVGGGPAGMKAAETLARRGHEVRLLEGEAQLGGQVNLILMTPHRETFAWVTRDLESQLRKLGVEIELATQATAELVARLAPDGVIVATGALPPSGGGSIFAPRVERLPGAEQENVLSVWDVLLNAKPVGERVVVLDDDGSRYTAGTAEYLLDAGKQVTVVCPWTSLFPATAATIEQSLLYERLFKKGLTFQLNSWARNLRGHELAVYNLYTGAEETLELDTLVLATGPKANDGLYFELKAQGFNNLHRIGDCVAPRKLDHAIYEGYLAGRELWSPEERYIDEGELERWEDKPLVVGT